MAARAYETDWEIIRELGAGGQGKVYEVRHRRDYDRARELFTQAVRGSNEPDRIRPLDREMAFQSFSEAVLAIVRSDSAEHRGALKVLHGSDDARDAERADERIAREMEAMKAIEHPNLLKILDCEPEARWFVSEYHAAGTLAQNPKYAGDLHGSLKALRPLIEGVARLHKQAIVHRDIKPENIFISSQGDLILGDFGLVFFTDESHTRVSATLENVGSRDWMAPWAVHRRVDDVTPAFDVFSLGKVLWSMLSGSGVLPFWYFDRSGYNVEERFPDAPHIKWANRLFARCIVEEEQQCLRSAKELLACVDETLAAIDRGADIIANNVKRRCRVCGLGEYEFRVDRTPNKTREFGLTSVGSRTFKVFTCANCGHMQFFTFGAGENPPAWGED